MSFPIAEWDGIFPVFLVWDDVQGAQQDSYSLCLAHGTSIYSFAVSFPNTYISDSKTSWFKSFYSHKR